MTPEERVFNLGELREVILEYAFWDECQGDLSSYPNIKSCRLVNKSWSQTTSELFRVSKSPLFKLELGQRSGATEDSDFLSNFMNAVTGESKIEDQVPPFSVQIHANFFRIENFTSFRNLLSSSCAQSLVELRVDYPSDGGSMPFLFLNLSLPKLKIFDVTFLSDSTGVIRNLEESTSRSNDNAIYFIQTVLVAAGNLNYLNFHTIQKTKEFCQQQPAPLGFDWLHLPQSLQKLWVTCNERSSDLELLRRNALPNLTFLEFNIPCNNVPEGHVSAILENVKGTLTQLTIYEKCEYGCQKNVEYFRFPQMEKLKEFTTDESFCELEHVQNLMECLPKLEELHLESLTLSMFSKWMNGCRFELVKEMGISLLEETFDLERMQSISGAFPNLNFLSITFRGDDLTGLQCLFGNMGSLEELHLLTEDHEMIRDSTVWDAALLGIPQKWVASLKKNPKLWDSPELKNESFSSIRNLTELKKLVLSGGLSRKRSLISRITFKHALFSMPKLHTVTAGGPFVVSNKIINKWEKTPGRIFVEEHF